MIISFILNGEEKKIDVPPDLRLLDLLRDEFNLKSVKEGCGEGECGACSVLMDKKAVASCLILASQLENREIETVEGLKQKGELDIFTHYFARNGAVQCGFCTPGMVITARALLYRNKNPEREEIKEAIAGNLCRCTGYNNIIRAIEEIAARGELE